MKILMIIDGLRIGGVERRMLSLVKKGEETANLSFEIIVLSTVIEYVKELESIKAQVHLIERKPKRDPRAIFKIIKICKCFKPDIIHAWGSMSAIYAIPAKALLQIKLLNGMIMNAPLKLPLKLSLRGRIAFLFSDLIISNSLAGIKAYNPPSHKTVCVHNGFNFDRIINITDSNTMRQRFGISTKYVIGMVGRFEKDRDFGAFVLSAIEVLKIRKDVTFIAIGEGKTYEQIKSSVPQEFKDYFVFTGKREDIESLINMFDIGILFSSLKFREGFSNVIMEYMALGKATIATKCGGNNEIVVDKVTGYLIPDNNIILIVEKIIFLLEESTIRKNMGFAGQELIIQKFSIERMVSRYIELYQLFKK
jgi:glycosyltransferase involved in cell wall biosynthesis